MVDLKFIGTLPRGAYHGLKFGEELMILDCTEDLEALKNRLYQWGKRQKEPRRYKVTVVGERTYVKCLPKNKAKPAPPPVDLSVRTRSRHLVKLSRRRAGQPNRTEWNRDVLTGVYSCTDRDDGTRWVLYPQNDPIWRWLIYRNGEPVAKSRRLTDAKTETQLLL